MSKFRDRFLRQEKDLNIFWLIVWRHLQVACHMASLCDKNKTLRNVALHEIEEEEQAYKEC
jgi:hypothetical protein